jgi:GntR family transcriptional regulator/MocR family aminotransferase
LIGYGDPRGEIELRRAIADYVAAMHGMSCDPDQIIVVGGTEQIIEVAATAIASPGDPAWFEYPSYPFMRGVLERAGFTPVAVPVDDGGMVVEEGVRLAPTARLALVSTSHQVPSGAAMSLERRIALLDWAEDADAWILENDFDGDYRFNTRAVPALYSLARSERVVYVGSMSKLFASGLRIGYLVVPRELASYFTFNKVSPGSALTQLTLARFCASGDLASHMRYLRGVHERRRAILIDALNSEASGLLEIAATPEAGLRVLTFLPPHIDDKAVSRACLARGVKVEALSICHDGEVQKSGLLIGFGSTPEDRIAPAVRTLAAVLAEFSPPQFTFNGTGCMVASAETSSVAGSSRKTCVATATAVARPAMNRKKTAGSTSESTVRKRTPPTLP